MKLALIGDVHNKIDRYELILNSIHKKHKDITTIQIGDFFVNKNIESRINDLFNAYGRKDFFIRGNHECWNSFPENLLHRYGIFSKDIFYVSGAFSVDKEYQVRAGYWNPFEELTYKEGKDCLDLYEKTKPKILIAHDAPRSIGKKIGNPKLLSDFGFDPDNFSTRTSELLQQMISTHNPKLFVHGHFHKDYCLNQDGCLFIGLGELSTLILDISEEKIGLSSLILKGLSDILL